MSNKKEIEIQRLVQAISNAVAEQRLPPGTRLVEAELVARLKANRNHVRSALKRLELERIVSIVPNKGASISQPSVEEAREVFTARSIVERGIIEILSEKCRKLDIAILKKQLKAELAAIQNNKREQIIKESGEFHLLLARLAGNSVLADMLQNLITRSSLIISLYQIEAGELCGCDDHKNIVQALENSDINAAILYMKQHLADIESHLKLDFWENKKVDMENVFRESEP
ncbi:GntR family transcriptional regulator [Marinomonas balearica]|uniref:DNA-binding GntR family transcriptional regulator n=1 Tax=Marinomonas balearica TaxID=491947 RepID=A0A4R6MHC0_9GAMM|nr:GntR family transcriptional regulator [Marinomonas balearica]TDO99559.1 DNA-binding GntR family transcriptional regulator [Marinomonas balearica]